MEARVSFYDMGSASKDDAVRAFDQATAALEQMEGNEGGMLLVSADGDKAITITFWQSEEALRASEAQANQTRQQAAGEVGMTIRDVEAYTLGLTFGRPPTTS